MTPAQKIPVGTSYQVPLARAVKAATNLPTVRGSYVNCVGKGCTPPSERRYYRSGF
jgi:hypothetical protein